MMNIMDYPLEKEFIDSFNKNILKMYRPESSLDYTDIGLLIKFENGNRGYIEVYPEEIETIIKKDSSKPKYKYICKVWDHQKSIKSIVINSLDIQNALKIIIQIKNSFSTPFNIVSNLDEFIDYVSIMKTDRAVKNSYIDVMRPNHFYYKYLFKDNKENLDLLKLSLKYS